MHINIVTHRFVQSEIEKDARGDVITLFSHVQVIRGIRFEKNGLPCTLGVSLPNAKGISILVHPEIDYSIEQVSVLPKAPKKVYIPWVVLCWTLSTMDSVEHNNCVIRFTRGDVALLEY